MHRGTWQATVHRVTELDTTKMTQHAHTRSHQSFAEDESAVPGGTVTLCHPGRTGQSWDLNPELSDPRDRFSMCLCGGWGGC